MPLSQIGERALDGVPHHWNSRKGNYLEREEREKDIVRICHISLVIPQDSQIARSA